MYYPPGQTSEDEKALNEYVTNVLDKSLRDYPLAGVIIAGDFNKMRLRGCADVFTSKNQCGLPQEVETP